VSRLCDRVTRRPSPGLDKDLSGLGLSLIYSGNVEFSCNTLPIPSFFDPGQSRRGKSIRVQSRAAREIHSEAESRLVRGRRPHQRLPVICPPRCARSRDLRYRRHPAVPSTSLQTIPGVRRCLRQSPPRGFGRARRRGCRFALRAFAIPKLGENKRLPDRTDRRRLRRASSDRIFSRAQSRPVSAR
jgi:hypothetical protein